MHARSILVVVATPAELRPATVALGRGASLDARTTRFDAGARSIDVLVTGVGMVATAAWTSRALGSARYDLALDFGVCGSFDPALAPGRVVHVITDRLAELGAEDGEAFLTLADLALAGEDVVGNSHPPAIAALEALPAVRGVTVNTVHGCERTIADVVARCAPQVESMEGAAFMYACAIHGIPYAQVRAVSNVVEQRNRAAWKLAEAIGNLNACALEILNSP